MVFENLSSLESTIRSMLFEIYMTHKFETGPLFVNSLVSSDAFFNNRVTDACLYVVDTIPDFNERFMRCVITGTKETACFFKICVVIRFRLQYFAGDFNIRPLTSSSEASSNLSSPFSRFSI